jgi:hypothetical protein
MILEPLEKCFESLILLDLVYFSVDFSASK